MFNFFKRGLLVSRPTRNKIWGAQQFNFFFERIVLNFAELVFLIDWRRNIEPIELQIFIVNFFFKKIHEGMIFKTAYVSNNFLPGILSII